LVTGLFGSENPNTRRKILDKVVVLDKGSASVNAPPPLHRKITSAIDYQSLTLSHE
jgi:hypothetical protein